MPTITESTTITQIQLPTVPPGTPPAAIAESLNSVTASVIVSQPEVGRLKLVGPDIKIPAPKQGQSPWQWTFLWSFLTDEPGLSVDAIGVKISQPDNPDILIGTVTPGPAENQLQVTIDIDAALLYTSFDYWVWVVEGGNRFQHDPTIVVTQEPIG